LSTGLACSVRCQVMGNVLDLAEVRVVQDVERALVGRAVARW
jgi:hypothetical protein